MEVKMKKILLGVLIVLLLFTNLGYSHSADEDKISNQVDLMCDEFLEFMNNDKVSYLEKEFFRSFILGYIGGVKGGLIYGLELGNSDTSVCYEIDRFMRDRSINDRAKDVFRSVIFGNN